MLLSEKTLYDDVLYPSHAYTETHPDRMAVLARLFGMTPAPVERCRVLEIGCSDGGNLIPMALSLPSAQFTGIDLAAMHIRHAQAVVLQLGVQNARFEQMNLMDLSPEFGEFDYIVAHGVYSWVPPEVQAKLLAICQANLSRDGVAFISYNAQPAGHMRRALRDMMLFHTSGHKDSAGQVREGKKFLQFLSGQAEPNSLLKALLDSEGSQIINRAAYVTAHDELNSIYAPVHFAEFAAEARRHGLQFLSEARMEELADPAVSPEALEEVEKWSAGDVVRREQYLDFLRFRGFRRTLLCRSEQQLRRDNLAARLKGLWIASRLRTSSQLGWGAVRFERQGEPGSMETNDPLVIAALEGLADSWPHGQRFEELSAQAEACVTDSNRWRSKWNLAEVLLDLAVNGLVDLRTYRPFLAAQVSLRPTASPLARWQAAQDSLLTNLLHVHIEMKDAPARAFLRMVDGTRDRRALGESLLRADPVFQRVNLEALIPETLAAFYRMGLLMA